MRDWKRSAILFSALTAALFLVNLGCSVEEDSPSSSIKAPTAHLVVSAAPGSLSTASVTGVHITTTGAALKVLLTARPGTAGFDFLNETAVPPAIQTTSVRVFCDHQLGCDSHLPGNPACPFRALPAYRTVGTTGNELEILRAASGTWPTTMAIPAGFNLAVLMAPDSGDTRTATTTATLSWTGTTAQNPGQPGRYLFSGVVVDKDGSSGANSQVLLVTR